MSRRNKRRNSKGQSIMTPPPHLLPASPSSSTDTSQKEPSTSGQATSTPSSFTELIPVLTFAPLAFLKLVFMRDIGDTEVGGFALTSPADPFHILDFLMLPQECTGATVEMENIAEFLDEMADRDIAPAQCNRIWIHTHPGDSPNPSTVDETTFRTIFGQCDHSVMFILAKHGRTFARLKTYNGRFTLSSPIDVRTPSLLESFMTITTPPADLGKQWSEEYKRLVRPPARTIVQWSSGRSHYDPDSPLARSESRSSQHYSDTRFLPSSRGDKTYNPAKGYWVRSRDGRPALWFCMSKWRDSKIFQEFLDEKQAFSFDEFLEHRMLQDDFREWGFIDRDGELLPRFITPPRKKAQPGPSHSSRTPISAIVSTIGTRSGEIIVASRIPNPDTTISSINPTNSHIGRPACPEEAGL